MWKKPVSRAFVAVLTTCVAGCSLLQTEESNVEAEPRQQTSMEVLKDVEVFLRDSQGRMQKLDPKQLKAGQHIQILTGGVPNTHVPEIMMHATMIAGTVKLMDGDRVVLQDVVMIKESRSKPNSSFGSRIPYVSRWGRSTGIGRVSTAVPGEVAIKLSEILNASELTDVEFDAVRKNGGGFERIGVDFDFNVADDLEATPHQ